MTRTISLEMHGGVQVVVPDLLNLLTPYVLSEQRDWFEDEIHFVRRVLQAGERVIDIGASYGLYTLTMAKIVGPTGAIWAFEPASAPAELLAQSIAANRFGNVTLERSALSKSAGKAELAIVPNSEMNALFHGRRSSQPTETVPVVTLDDCRRRYGWNDIAFVKIDAEGEESNILKGGKRFLADCSPLILYELRSGNDWHRELVRQFARLGYDSYRLMPGLELLVPFDPGSVPDAYLLNLFCCKKDRAASLAARGLLIDPAAIAAYRNGRRLENFFEAHRDAYTWSRRLATLPYGARLAGLWESHGATADSIAVNEALAFYAVSRDATVAPLDRFNALEASLVRLRSVCDNAPIYLRLASLARVSRDQGDRRGAVSALAELLDTPFDDQLPDPSEPFLAPLSRFDSIDPGDKLRDWIWAACAEAFEKLHAYSSYGEGIAAKPRLERIASLGFGSEEMARRLNLVNALHGAAKS